jgi:hypothetical protein
MPEEPLVFKADPSQLPVMDLLITSDQMDLTKLRTYVENELQDQFTSIEGTAGTEITGGLKREIRIHIDPVKLQGYGLSVDKVAQRLKDENLELLGGRVTSARRDYIVRTVGEFSNVDEIGNLIISKGKNEGLILLKDVADVKDAYAVQRIKNKLNKVEGVKLSVFKQTGANTIEVSDKVAKKIKELKTIIPPSINLDIIYDQADYIRAAVSGVRDAALIAALLVVIVTAFFLTGWKRVLIVSLTLPVTLLGTFFFMQLLNFSINIFTLGGLVVAITVLLDNCIVILENITRIQEEEPEELHPVQKGATQVSGAVLTATLTFIALFLPFLLVPGLVSLLFRELIITVAITITLSLIVALTLTPTLTSLFFKEGKPVHIKKGIISKLADGIIALIIKPYKPILRWALKFRWIVMLLTLGLFFVGLIFLNKIGSEFLPKADDGLITIKLKMPTGSSMEETHKVISQVENFVKQQPYIDKYSSLLRKVEIGAIEKLHYEEFIADFQKDCRLIQLDEPIIDILTEFLELVGNDFIVFSKLSKLLEPYSSTMLVISNTPLHAIYERLKILGFADVCVIDCGIARGLDYYTGPVFEIDVKLLGKEKQVCGGGRYDKLISEFGGELVPATGFAFGFDRLLIAMERSEIKIPITSRADLFIASMQGCEATGMMLANQLRERGIHVETDLMNRNFKNAAKFVNSMNIPYMIFIGPKEKDSGQYTIKNFLTQQQFESQSIESIIDIIKNKK